MYTITPIAHTLYINILPTISPPYKVPKNHQITAPIGKNKTAEYNSLLKDLKFLKIVYLNIPAHT